MKSFFNMTPWTQVDQTHLAVHTHHLGECAPCKAKRLQEEANEEFKRRFGMIDLNRMPLASAPPRL